MKLFRSLVLSIVGVAPAAAFAGPAMPLATLNEGGSALLPLAGFVALNLGLYVFGRERRHGGL